MQIITIDNGIFNSNSYVVYDEKSLECMIVDFGVSANYTSRIIKENSKLYE
jgi:hypothetical protein